MFKDLRIVFKNTFWLSLGNVIGKLLSFSLAVFATRILGPDKFGEFNFAFAFASLFIIIIDIGMSDIIIREFSGEEGLKDIYSIISMKFVLGLAMLVFVFLGSFFITGNADIQKLILILGLYNFIAAFLDLGYCFFRARQRMEYQAMAMVAVSFLTFAFGVIFILFSTSAKSLALGYLAAALAGLVFSVAFFHFKFFPIKVEWNKKIWKRYFGMSWPLAFAGFFGVIYNNTDSVMMGYFGQMIQTGWYNAAYKIAWAALAIAGPLTASFYSVLSKSKKSNENLQKNWDYQMNLLILFSFPAVMGGIILAPKIIDLFFGPSFLSSVLALQILMVMTGLIILGISYKTALILFNQQAKFFWVLFSGGILNVVLNYILIPKHSLYGASAATVATNLLILISTFYLTGKFTSIKPFNLKILKVSAIAAISTFIMSLVISRPSIYNLSIFISIPIAILIYFISVGAFYKLIWKRAEK